LAPQNAEGVDAGESEGKLFGIGMDGGGRFESQKVTRTNAILKEDVLLWRIYGIVVGTRINAILASLFCSPECQNHFNTHIQFIHPCEHLFHYINITSRQSNNDNGDFIGIGEVVPNVLG